MIGSFVNATFKVVCPQIKMVNKLMLCMQLIFIDLSCSCKKATLPGGSRDYHVVIVLFSSHVYSMCMCNGSSLFLHFSYSEGRDDGSFTTRIAKLVASTGKVKNYFLLQQYKVNLNLLSV